MFLLLALSRQMPTGTTVLTYHFFIIPFKANSPFIKKPVTWFILQINWVPDTVALHGLQTSRRLLVQTQQSKHQSNVLTLFKVSNKRRHIFLVSLILDLNKFHILYWFLCCWVWTSRYRLGIIYRICVKRNYKIN